MSSSIMVLRNKLIKAFAQHYSLNDTAHMEDHFEEVFTTGCFINSELNLWFSEELILMAAYLHDLFAWSRENHHELSFEFVKGTCHPLISEMSPQDRRLLSVACRHHRASFKGEFEGEFDELINAADRGLPKTPKQLLTRAIHFRTSRGFQGTREELVRDAVNHVKEKYGTDGYARYPEMYSRCFSASLEGQREAVSMMDYRNYL